MLTLNLESHLINKQIKYDVVYDDVRTDELNRVTIVKRFRSYEM